jgi:energy-converting hydrogenase Eha subunit C
MCSSSTICTLCDATSYFQLSTGATQCSCLTGYYFNSPARNCVSCVTLSPSCNSCSSSNICLSCSNGFSLLTGMCICPSCNYIDIATGTCLPCPATCPTCAYLVTLSQRPLAQKFVAMVDSLSFNVTTVILWMETAVHITVK